jgi:hypothetical protein
MLAASLATPDHTQQNAEDCKIARILGRASYVSSIITNAPNLVAASHRQTAEVTTFLWNLHCSAEHKGNRKLTLL